MDALRQIFNDYRSARGAALTCPAWVNCSHLSTGTFSLVGCELNQLIPRCILNALTQTMIANHPFDIQIFKGNYSEHGNKCMAQLVSKAAATVSDALMDTPRRFALLASLRFRKSLFIRAKEAWISYLLARRKRCKRVQANVYTNGSLIRGKRLRFNFNREAREPLACRRARDGKRLNLTFNRAMQLDSHISDFREAQLAIVQSETGLSICEGIVSFVRAETRKARLLLCLDTPKEAVKRFLYALQDILQDLGMYARDIRANLFNVGQLVGLFNIANRPSFESVGVTPFLQTRVVEFAAKRKGMIQASGLGLARIDAKLKSASCYIFVSHVCHVSIVSGLVRAGMLLTAAFRLACIVAYVEAQI